MVTVRGKVAATSGWWVTTTIVVPKSSPSEWIRWSTWSRSAWLSWLVGSSARSRRGEVETAQARARRWRWPPDIVETTWSACSTRPTRSSSSVSGSASSRSLPERESRAKAMFWRAVAYDSRLRVAPCSIVETWRERIRAR